jgi:hypothetical protein
MSVFQLMNIIGRRCRRKSPQVRHQTAFFPGPAKKTRASQPADNVDLVERLNTG